MFIVKETVDGFGFWFDLYECKKYTFLDRLVQCKTTLTY